MDEYWKRYTNAGIVKKSGKNTSGYFCPIPDLFPGLSIYGKEDHITI